MTLISDLPWQHPQNQVEHEERANDDEWDEVEPVPGVPWSIVGLQWDRSYESRNWEGAQVQRELNISARTQKNLQENKSLQASHGLEILH